MAGRIEIDDVAPVVSDGRFRPRPSSARSCRSRRRCGARATTPSRRRWWCAITARHYPQLADGPAGPVNAARSRCRSRTWSSPASQGQAAAPADVDRVATPDVFHGQFSPDAVGLWTFRVDGWGDPIATWRKNVTAKLDAGQSESELSNDLLIGAQLLERAATGVPRQDRYPLIEAAEHAAQARRPVHPRRRGAAPGGRRAARRSIRCANWSPAASSTASGWTGRWPGSAPGTRFSRAPPAAWDGEGQARARHVRHRQQGAAAHRQDGLRHRLPAADPPDRQGAPQGPQQQRHRRRPRTSARRGRSAATRAATTRCTRSSAPSTTSTTSSPRRATRASRSRSTWRCSARPTIRGPRTHPEWFTVLPDGTIAYAENPPKKYQDIYPVNFDNDPAGIYAEVLRVVRFWMSPRRQGLPGRQPAHQAAQLLGLADRRGQERRSRRAVPRRGVHPARPAVRTGQTRLHAVLYVLHLAHGEVGADRVRRADRRARRLRPAEPVRQHARHPAREPAVRRTGHVRDPRRDGRRR